MLPELLFTVTILAAGLVALNPKAKELFTQAIPKLSSSKEEIVSLCVVIPASTARSLEDKNSPIDIFKIIKLLESVSYFICTNVSDANLKEKRLEFDNNYENNLISSDSMQEVYVRIDIKINPADENKIIAKRDRYILQRNLEAYKVKNGIIREKFVLKSLKGLESFNRI